MLLPYRVKNPPKQFPIATLGLIVANVVVYLITTDSFLFVNEGILKGYGYQFGKSSVFCMISSMFLHADPLHLIGNMLFLWVFGPPVEGRLGIPKYLAVYFLTGISGHVLQGVLDVATFGHGQLGLGASGAIMGVVGAYWYIFSWSTVCVAYFYWFFVPRWGVWEVQAIWIIGLYFLMDLGEGLLTGSTGVGGGVANFAHVGGAVAGALCCMALRTKRDSGAMSEAKAIQADMGDLTMMPLHALETMDEEDPGNPDIIKAMIGPAIGLSRLNVVEEAMNRAGHEMIDKAPDLVANWLVNLRGNPNIYQPAHLLRLAGLLERSNDSQQALNIYLMVINRYPNSGDCETALYRSAQCCWNTFHDGAKAQRCLNEMLRRFPNGYMVSSGKALLKQISG